MISVKCDKCNGKGKLPYRLAEGVCFQCNGSGYYNMDENKLKEIEQKENELLEYRKQVAAYEQERHNEQLPQWNYTESMYNFRNKNETKMNEWQYNFISDLADKDHSRLSPKQKDMLFQIIGKFDPATKNIIEGYFK